MCVCVCVFRGRKTKRKGKCRKNGNFNFGGEVLILVHHIFHHGPGRLTCPPWVMFTTLSYRVCVFLHTHVHTQRRNATQWEHTALSVFWEDTAAMFSFILLPFSFLLYANIQYRPYIERDSFGVDSQLRALWVEAVLILVCFISVYFKEQCLCRFKKNASASKAIRISYHYVLKCQYNVGRWYMRL